MAETEGNDAADGRPPIAWSEGADPFAYVPGRALARGKEAAERFSSIVASTGGPIRLLDRDEPEHEAWFLIEFDDKALVEDDDETRENRVETLAAIRLARAGGDEVQPDHVFFAHGCDECCCAPHPSLTFDAILADPYQANPHRANPHRANPHRANPHRANPHRANPHRANPQTSSAIPAARRAFPEVELNGSGSHPRIRVLDTGLAEGAQLPALLGGSASSSLISGEVDQPDSDLVDTTNTTIVKDGWLDPVAGHGTFITGLIEQLAPGCEIRVEHVISGLGDVIESELFPRLSAILDLPPKQLPDILSLSFGGTAMDDAPALQTAIAKLRHAGIVVVASAGNDGSSQPQFPAAYEGVVAVGALGPDGPVPWTNYGEWVDACAPGADLVSAFFADFDGPEPRVNTFDPDRFEGWAIWSGTSFAAPVVVSALAREMVLGGCKASDAVARVLYGPAALHIRCLGTVVTV
jgi:Subtilase family